MNGSRTHKAPPFKAFHGLTLVFKLSGSSPATKQLWQVQRTEKSQKKSTSPREWLVPYVGLRSGTREKKSERTMTPPHQTERTTKSSLNHSPTEPLSLQMGRGRWSSSLQHPNGGYGPRCFAEQILGPCLGRRGSEAANSCTLPPSPLEGNLENHFFFGGTPCQVPLSWEGGSYLVSPKKNLGEIGESGLCSSPELARGLAIPQIIQLRRGLGGGDSWANSAS